MKFRKALLALFAVATLAGGWTAATPAPAQAYDQYPCEPNTSRGFLKYYCPLVPGNIPVFNTYEPSRHIVGWLVGGDSRNWFWDQYCANWAPYSYAGGWNTWWASTLADNGKFGYVPEAYFRGGGHYEADGVLKWVAPGGYVYGRICL